MAKISDLEQQFKQQTEAETERLTRIETAAFQKMQSDLAEQLGTSYSTLSGAISSHQNQINKILLSNENEMAERLDRNRQRLNAMLRGSVWLSLAALFLLVLTVTAWTLFVRDWVYPNPYQNLAIESCGVQRMCAMVIQTNPKTGERYRTMAEIYKRGQ